MLTRNINLNDISLSTANGELNKAKDTTSEDSLIDFDDATSERYKFSLQGLKL
jgi:hypothetical protein